MSDFNALADAFADMVWERLKERVEEVARYIFISGLQTHEVVCSADAKSMIEDAIEEHVDDVTHIDDERIGEACNEAVAEIFRGLARNL
jgi:hypothetical protein